MRQAGLCYCGKTRMKGYAHCRRCWERYSNYQASDIAKQRRNDRRDACRLEGICTYCQKAPADEGYSRCKPCREKFRKHSAKQRQRNGSYRLQDAEKAAAKMEERRENGLCYRCGQEPRSGKKTCKGCANKHKMSARRWRARRKVHAILQTV